MNKTDTAKQVIKEFPDLPTRTIARMLHKMHTKTFPSINNARACVAAVRGLWGKQHREARPVEPQFKKKTGWLDVLPDSIPQSIEPVVLPNQSKILVLSDIHAPYHDKQALQAAIECGIKAKPTDIYLNGDILDNYSISRWEPNPERRDVDQELQITRSVLLAFRKAFPKARMWYKHGNHEDRLEKFLVKNAAVLLGVPEFKLCNLLKFEDLKINEVATRQFAHAGKLTIIHGHELPGKSVNPANPAKTLHTHFRSHALCGHWHRASMHQESAGYPKEQEAAWTTGCLCDMSPEYAVINKWCHGMAIVEVAEDGTFGVDNVSIVNGKTF